MWTLKKLCGTCKIFVKSDDSVFFLLPPPPPPPVCNFSFKVNVNALQRISAWKEFKFQKHFTVLEFPSFLWVRAHWGSVYWLVVFNSGSSPWRQHWKVTPSPTEPPPTSPKRMPLFLWRDIDTSSLTGVMWKSVSVFSRCHLWGAHQPHYLRTSACGT